MLPALIFLCLLLSDGRMPAGMAAAVEGNALCTSPSMELFRAPDINALRKETIYILVKK